MGFVDTTPDPILPWFYNVVQEVGKSCPNQRVDVKLVQIMLKRVYEIGMVSETGEVFTKPKGEITVEGLCSGVTCFSSMKEKRCAGKLKPDIRKKNEFSLFKIRSI